MIELTAFRASGRSWLSFAGSWGRRGGRRRAALALWFVGVMAASLADFRAAAAQEEYLARVQKYFDEGATSSALIEVKNALQAEPDSALARLLLGRIHLRLGDPAAAEEAFLRARELGAAGEELELLLAYARLANGSFKDVVGEPVTETDRLSAMQRDLMAARGDALLALEKLDEAEEAYDRALEGSEHAMALRGKAGVALARERPEESRELLDRALALAPDNDEIVTADAEWYLRAGRYDQARARFAKAVELNPIKLVPRVGHVRALLGAGDVETALAEILVLRQVQPADPMIAFQESVAQLTAGNYEAAKKAADEVLASDPYHPGAANVAGSSAYALELYEQAVLRLLNYLQVRPQDKHARALLAASYLRLKDAARAKTVLQPVLEGEPEEPRALVLMAAAEALDGNPEAAARYLDKAFSLSPEDRALRADLGMIRIATVDPAHGEGDLDLVVVVSTGSGAGDEVGNRETTLIVALLKAGDFMAALENVQRLQATHPDNTRLLVLAGVAHAARDESSLAEAAFSRAIALNPASADARLNLARLHADTGDLDAARTLLEEVLAHHPDHNLAILDLASVASRSGELSEEARWLERAVAAQPDLPGPRRALALLYLKTQQPQKAIAAAEPALQHYPENVELLGLVGQSQLQAGMADEAIATFSKLVSIAPEKVDAHFVLARAYGLAGKNPEMESELNRALELDPNHLPSQIALARFLVLNGKPNEAEQRIQALKAAHPDNVEVMAQEGWILLQQGRAEEAVAPLTAAYELSEPTPNRELVESLSRAHWMARQWDASVAVQERWVSANPDDAAMLLSVGQAYTQLGRPEAATDAYRKVQALQPDNIVALNNLAWLLQTAAPEEALGYAGRASELAPGNPSIMDTFAWLLLQRGEAARAAVLFEEASRKAPENPQYRYHLAQALDRAGKKEPAKQILEELLADNRLEPEHAKIRQMLDQIED